MREVVQAIKEALEQDVITNGSSLKEALTKRLQERSTLIYSSDYPIAVINTKVKMHDDTMVSRFETMGLFDQQGITPEWWSRGELESIASIAPQYLQTVSIMCLRRPPKARSHFVNKRPLDHWKKLADVEDIMAMIELDTFDAKSDVCEVETRLRETIRKRKEVSALKTIAFVWIAAIPRGDDISKVIEHYFHRNSMRLSVGEIDYYLGWDEALKAISMRNFVCAPSI